MKLSVLTNLFGNLTLDEALNKFKSLGIDAVEIGCGGYPGKAHCDPEVLLGDDKALADWKATFEKYGLEIACLSVHGNPVHPDKAIAKAFHDDFVDAVLLAEKIGIDTVVTSPAVPAAVPRIRPPTGQPALGPMISSRSSTTSGTRCLSPIGRRLRHSQRHTVLPRSHLRCTPASAFTIPRLFLSSAPQ